MIQARQWRKRREAEFPAAGIRYFPPMKTADRRIAVEYRSVDALVPYARNSRTHDEGQVAQIAGSIREFGFTNPVLIDEEGGIIAGHGRVMAARKLGMVEVPTITLSGLTEAQRRAYVIADNKLALNAGWDFEMLAVELDELRDDDFDLSLLGFTQEELNELIGTPNAPPLDDGHNEYSRKIEAPTYTPKGDKPMVEGLFNREKMDALIRQIDDAEGITHAEKQFLTMAAARHVVFDYHQIAEFYCHAAPHLQALMENSALVIIDFDRAIESGFVHVTDRLGELVEGEIAKAEDA